MNGYIMIPTEKTIILTLAILATISASNILAWDGRVPVQCGWVPTGRTYEIDPQKDHAGFKCLSNVPLDLKRAGYEDCSVTGTAGNITTVRCLKDLGIGCNSNDECKGNSSGTASGTGCCEGKCAQKVLDWVGAYYCQNECKPGLIPGTQCK